MLIVTIDQIPGKNYEVLGIVRVMAKGFAGQYNNAFRALETEAENMDADAVVGFRYGQDASGNSIAYGTAVRFI